MAHVLVVDDEAHIGELVWLHLSFDGHTSDRFLDGRAALEAARTQPYDLFIVDVMLPGDVKPVLAKHCYRCHGAAQQKGGLRADTVAFLKEGGDTGASLTPGDSKASVLVQVLLGTHADISQMPDKKPALADADIAAIRAWIAAGAAAPVNEVPDKAVHWAFVAPERPAVPGVARPDRSRNTIDRFIHARLDKDRIAPAPEADRAALLRRVSLDLTGLPPTLSPEP